MLRPKIKEWLKNHDKQCDLNADELPRRVQLTHRVFAEYVKTNKVTRICQRCGKKFTPIVGNQKYCNIHKSGINNLKLNIN